MEIATIIWVLVAIFGIAGIAGFMRSRREKVLGIGKNWFGIIAVLVAVFLAVGQMGYLSNYGVTFSASAPDNSGTPEPIKPDTKLCAVEDTTVTLSASDKYLSTATGGSHRYRVNGAPALAIADAGTFTASPGDKLDILWGNGTTTGIFGIVDSVYVPCVGTKTFTTLTVNNGSVTANNLNNLDQVGANTTLGAGDIKDAKIKIQGQYQKEFPYGFVAVVEFNKTTMDDVILTSSGVELSSSNTPQTFSPAMGTESSTKAYVLPGAISNTEYTYSVTLDADDTNDPVSPSSDVKITLYPLNNFVNDKNGGAFEGPSAEDEYNVITHGTVPVITVMVN